MSTSVPRPLIAIAASLALGACSNGEEAATPVAGEAAVDASAPVTARPRETRSVPVDIQGVTDVGATVRIKQIDLAEDATVIDVSVSFSSNMTNNVEMASTNTFIETPAGQRLMLKEPDGNPNLNIVKGDTMEGRLVFLGEVPANADRIFVVFNQGSTSDSIIGPYLRLEVPLTAAAAGGAR